MRQIERERERKLVKMRETRRQTHRHTDTVYRHTET